MTSEWSNASFYVEFFVLGSNFIIGPMLDILGRQKPIVISQIIVGICMILMTVDLGYTFFQIVTLRIIG